MQKLQAEAVCADLSRWILIAWFGRSGTRFLILRADLRSDGRRLLGVRAAVQPVARGGALRQGRRRWRKGRSGTQIDHILALGDLRDMSKPPGLKPRRSDVLNAGRDYGGDPTRRSSPAMVFQTLE